MKYLSLGKKFAAARIKSKLTQREVAQALGYSTAQFISNWERGVSAPPEEALPILARLYAIKPFIMIDWMVSFEHDQAKETGKRLKALFAGKPKRKAA